MLIFGQCDCCGDDNRVLHRGEASGCEAYACASCRYTDPKDEAYEIEDEIEACEADPNRHGGGEHRGLLLANLRTELARIQSWASAEGVRGSTAEPPSGCEARASWDHKR